MRQLLKDVRGQLVHLAHQREHPRDRHRRRGCSTAATTSRPTTGTAWSAARSVLAHNVHPTDHELKVLAARDASVAHCPTSNSALGSGLFPLARHLAYGVRVALGSDVGAGTGFSLLKEGAAGLLHAAAAGRAGLPAEPAHLLHLATTRRRDALGLARPGRRPERREALRRAVAQAPLRARRSTSPCATPPAPRTRWPRRSRSVPRPTCGPSGSTDGAWRSSDAAASTASGMRRCRIAHGLMRRHRVSRPTGMSEDSHAIRPQSRRILFPLRALMDDVGDSCCWDSPDRAWLVRRLGGGTSAFTRSSSAAAFVMREEYVATRRRTVQLDERPA